MHESINLYKDPRTPIAHYSPKASPTRPTTFLCRQRCGWCSWPKCLLLSAWVHLTTTYIHLHTSIQPFMFLLYIHYLTCTGQQPSASSVLNTLFAFPKVGRLQIFTCWYPRETGNGNGSNSYRRIRTIKKMTLSVCLSVYLSCNFFFIVCACILQISIYIQYR